MKRTIVALLLFCLLGDVALAEEHSEENYSASSSSFIGIGCPDIHTQEHILLAARSGNIQPRFQVVARITRNKSSTTEEYYTVNAPNATTAKSIIRTKIKDKYSNVTGIKFVKTKRLD